MIKYLSSVNKEHSVFIYRFVHPVSEIVKYIGVTNDPKARYRKHLSHKKRTKLTNWFKSLTNEGLLPKMVIIDSANDRESANNLEKFWIIKHKEWGFDLKNMTDGGDGGDTMSGRKLSKEARLKISRAKKGVKRNVGPKFNASKRKAVLQICPNTKQIIAEFESVRSASKITGCSKTNISKMANGSIKETIKLVGGYEWRYRDKL